MEEYSEHDGIAGREFKRLRNIIEQKNNEILALNKEITEFNNEKNWMRAYDFKGNLTNQAVLYKPRLDFRKRKQES